MSWQERVADKVKETEENIKSVLPRTYAARFKVFLDRFLPYSIVLLLVLFALHFIGGVNSSTANAISYLNWLLIAYFTLRLAMAFRLAESDQEFLRQHWFDALLVLPAFALLQEIRALTLFSEGEAEAEALTGVEASKNAGIAAQITKIIKIIKRSISF